MTSSSHPQLPRFSAIVVAAGKGLRAGQAVPKQFALWRGKPLLRHSVEALQNAGAQPIMVAIPPSAEDIARKVLAGLDQCLSVPGGETRQQSVLNALAALEPFAPDAVLIHDAARPDLPGQVITRLLNALMSHPGAIPVLPVVDSLALIHDEQMSGSAPREKLRRVQTPQAFRFSAILDAHRSWQGAPDAGDDAQVARAAGLAVAVVEGHERLRKLTFSSDFSATSATQTAERSDVSGMTEKGVTAPMYPRIGIGFDVHRLVPNEELWLCGVKIEHDRGLSGHSDADVGLHALVDAILGALAAGDIGQHFPPSDPEWHGARSSRFVDYAVGRAQEAGYRIGNVDLTLICEEPRIGPHRAAMRERLADLLMTGIDAISVKATTTERLGFTGRGEGIAAQVVVTLVPATTATLA